MENLKTVSALVKNILEHDHKARNTDNHLYLMVLEHYSGLRGMQLKRLPQISDFSMTAIFHMSCQNEQPQLFKFKNSVNVTLTMY